MRFSALKRSGRTDLNLELYDTKSGSLQISCEYVALLQVREGGAEGGCYVVLGCALCCAVLYCAVL